VTEDAVEQTRETYDRVAADYDRRTSGPDPEFVAFRATFAGDVDGTIADLGCGPGRDLAAFRAAGLTAFGVDLSTGMLRRAAGAALPVVRGDIRRPPVHAGALGGIWSSAALLHVPRPDVPATLAAWHALLRPGGHLGLSTSLGGDEGWELAPYDGAGPGGGELHRWFVHHDQDDLLGMLISAGFTIQSHVQRTSHRHWLMVRATA
jgi:SAM-dependent methyltransferase